MLSHIISTSLDFMEKHRKTPFIFLCLQYRNFNFKTVLLVRVEKLPFKTPLDLNRIYNKRTRLDFMEKHRKTPFNFYIFSTETSILKLY